ncbi:MAG: DUF2892 domain-containing protein [Bdellovibrionota bacterium]
MVAGFIPFDAGRSSPRELPERVFIELPKPNIAPFERGLTLVAGLAIAFEALRRRRRAGGWTTAAALIGGGIIAARAIGGYCPVEAFLQNRRSDEERRLDPHEGRVRQFLPRILRSISIRASREEILARLKDLPNVDGIRFEILGEPMGDEIRWNCQKIGSYSSSVEADSSFSGVIRLIDGPPNKGVELQASIDEIPEALGAAEVESIIRRVLRSLKQFIEAGEIATTSGQSHGHRRRFSLSRRFGVFVHKLMNKEELRYVGAMLERS